MPKVQASTKVSRGRSAPYSVKPEPQDLGVTPSERTCHVCKKDFPRQIDLDRHQRTHSDDIEVRRPYRCAQCPKRFGNKDALKPHIQSKHSSKADYECRICGQRHKTRSGQIHHEKRHSRSKGIPRRKKEKGYTDTVYEMSNSPDFSELDIFFESSFPGDSDQFRGESCLSVDPVESESESYYEMPVSLDPVTETFFASRLSPTLECTLGARSSRKEVFNSSVASSTSVSESFEAQQYRFDLSMDSAPLDTYFPVVSLSFSHSPTAIKTYGPGLSVELVHDQPSSIADVLINESLNQFPFDLSQEAESNFGIEPYTYPLNDQLYLPDPPAIANSTHELDASWEAWIAQGGHPSLMAYFLSPFPFNDDGPYNMGYSHN